jgi:hypothetical protein
VEVGTIRPSLQKIKIIEKCWRISRLRRQLPGAGAGVAYAMTTGCSASRIYISKDSFFQVYSFFRGLYNKKAIAPSIPGRPQQVGAAIKTFTPSAVPGYIWQSVTFEWRYPLI